MNLEETKRRIVDMQRSIIITTQEGQNDYAALETALRVLELLKLPNCSTCLKRHEICTHVPKLGEYYRFNCFEYLGWDEEKERSEHE